MNRQLVLIVTTLFLFAAVAHAEKKFTVTSDPDGAKVQFNGETVGVTPLDGKLKNHFFNGPKYLWSDFLNQPIEMTISKDGYVTKTMVITSGPFRWVNLNYTAEKIYYVIKTTSFHVKLDQIGAFMGTNPLAASVPGAATPATASNTSGNARLSTEEIVQRSLPAVVTVKAGSGSGSGFFITDTGVIVTNKHVVAGETSASIIDSRGQSYQSESIFVHATNDLALIKVPGNNFPYLRIADPATLNVGADVLAMGSPGLPGYSDLLPNSVTRGIVSAFRKEENYGVLVQTDVSINAGNSGGPLLNSSGGVVGVNTLKFRQGGATGINFAILSSEVLKMLKDNLNYVPAYLASSGAEASLKPEQPAKAPIDVTSEPSGAEIFVNDKFVSSTPSKLDLPLGEHTLRIVRPGFKPWERKILIEIGSTKTLNAILEKEAVVTTKQP